MLGDHAVYDGPEEGGAGGLGVPVAGLPSEVCPLDPCEILRLGQDSEQVAQEVAQTGRTLTDGLFVHGPEGGWYGVRAAIGLIHTRKLSLITRCDKIGSEARGLMNSLLHRGLHMTTGALPRGYGGPIEIQVVTKDAPATWVTSLVEWLGMHRMELHLSGPEYSGMLTQQDTDGDDGPLQVCWHCNSELPTSTKEVLLRATECWLVPELVDGDRMVVEVLSFSAAGRGECAHLDVTWLGDPGGECSACREVVTLRSPQGDDDFESCEFDLWPWGH